MTKVMNKIGIPITWITPSGLNIVQKYYVSKTNKIAINFAGKTKKMIVREWTEEVDTLHQSGGIIPNIIHSLDASHLINVVISANENKIEPVITVHFCFICHPNNLNNLSYLVRKFFIDLYTRESFLEKFHQTNKQIILDNDIKILYDSDEEQEYVLIKRRRVYLPEIPKMGYLNLQEIIHSKYMIT
jgi:DNA-directed RNA polymerase